MTDQPLYYRIGEVAKEAGVAPHVLRYWETEFPQLRPRKTSTGQRIYTPKDLALVLRIRQLLHQERYTISGARQRLAEERRPAARKAEVEPPTTEGEKGGRQEALDFTVKELRGILDMLKRRR